MNEEQRKKLENTIQDTFRLEERFIDFEAKVSVQLLLAQSDLLKNLASIIVALTGVGYLLGKVSLNFFSISASIFSLISLVFVFSYIREKIDNEWEGLEIARQGIENKAKEIREKIVEAAKNNKDSIYFDYAKEENTKLSAESKSETHYTGEIFLFLFYCILFSSVGVVVAERVEINLVYQFIALALILIVSRQISFKEWSIRLIGFISRNIDVKTDTKNI